MRKKSIKKAFVGILAATLALGMHSSMLGAVAGASLDDDFSVPTFVDRTGYVGEKMEIARVMPTDEDAEHYSFIVLNEQNEKVETDGYSFLPQAAGKYKCLYSYVLDGKTREYAYTVVVEVKDGPVFKSAPVFPNAFISGKKYVLPTLEAADYTSGKEVKADVSVAVTYGGVAVPVTNNTFVPTFKTQTDQAEIVYTATSDGKSAKISVSVPVVKVADAAGKLSMTELFARQGFSNVKATEEKLTFTANGNAEALLANKQAADGLELEFGFGEYDQAESIVVTLQSYEDPSVALTVEFKKGRKSAGVGSVILNGKTTKAYTYAKGNALRLSYSDAKKQFLGVGDEFLFDVTTDAQGGEFTGFPGGLVKVGVAVKNTYGTCDLDLYKVNRQRLSSSDREQIAPTLYMEEFNTEYAVGDTITLPAAYALDVVDPNAELRVTVSKGNTTVKDLSGNEIEGVLVDPNKPISFKVEKSGNYRVSYDMLDTAAVDDNGDPIEESQSKSIRVYDYEAPVISVNGSVKTTVKKGDTITIPEVKVTDNDGGNLTMLQVCMIRPTGYIDAIADNLSSSGTPNTDTVKSSTYTFAATGTYYLRLMATDQYGNYEKKEYVIKCED